ncbi:hypothetical protein BCF55_0637 [Hydrogenivirga caldilitoris]|uniref:DUF763 domain-containing protein n=1 Tax=Hydrogenivirga caldilitoris TaxID=246264 RepID=A0A497XN39_9AQUI|nr:DUF763 domain-containing protein [Hydrogenivirga caldilitoris]RLJ70366.1 hypothetical protein BCF55_0637 [Hydrogenivirga caldilitoris]
MRRGIANLPLHYGKAPPWLFKRMVELSKSIVELIVIEHGRRTFLERLSDPYWFQAFGCVLGFDWHSSGLTTTVCGALKESLKGLDRELGLYVAGGKGKSALKTPEELERIGETVGINTETLKDISRLVAKVDNTLLQDGYQLYHHTIIFTEEGLWAVVQQGMNTNNRYARRYHWFGGGLKSFVEEPHSGISAQKVHERITLNMTAKESRDSRESITELLKNKDILLREIESIETLNLPRRHDVRREDVDLKKLRETVKKVREEDIKEFEDVLRQRGMGPKTIRALALVSELIYGAKPSFKDPARYSFAHGGKDGYPFPVQKELYDGTIDTLKRAIAKAKVGDREKVDAIKKLSKILND